MDENIPNKTLGLHYDLNSDCFKFQQPKIKPKVATKRTVASDCLKIYDPLNWLGPFLLLAKIILQKAWKLKLDWDDPLPTHLQDDWAFFIEQMAFLPSIQIPRFRFKCFIETTELAIIADACSTSLGICVYVFDHTLQTTPFLLFSKGRICPQSPAKFSIARKELLSCVLASKVSQFLLKETGVPIERHHCFTDSLTSLYRIQKSAYNWKIWVRN